MTTSPFPADADRAPIAHQTYQRVHALMAQAQQANQRIADILRTVVDERGLGESAVLGVDERDTPDGTVWELVYRPPETPHA